MAKKRRKKPIYAFIDSQNVNLAIRDQGWILDFARFRKYLQDKYKVNKAFLFIGYVSSNKFLYKTLKNAGFIIIFKPTLEYKNRKKRELHTKGNVDAELVLHTMIEYSHYGKAIIVSGDGDFYCLADFLAKHGKLLHILIPNPKRYSALLRKFHKHFIFINGLKKKLGITKKRGSNLRTKP